MWLILQEKNYNMQLKQNKKKTLHSLKENHVSKYGV